MGATVKVRRHTRRWGGYPPTTRHSGAESATPECRGQLRGWTDLQPLGIAHAYDLTKVTSSAITFDCTHARKMARFWIVALGYLDAPPPPGWSPWEDWLRHFDVPESEWDDGASIVDDPRVDHDAAVRAIVEVPASRRVSAPSRITRIGTGLCSCNASRSTRMVMGPQGVGTLPSAHSR